MRIIDKNNLGCRLRDDIMGSSFHGMQMIEYCYLYPKENNKLLVIYCCLYKN